MSRIHLTIDRLTLPGGMANPDRKALVEALEGELRAILAEPGGRAAWARQHRTPILRLAPVPLEQGPAGGHKFGMTVAQSIGRGLKP